MTAPKRHKVVQNIRRVAYDNKYLTINSIPVSSIRWRRFPWMSTRSLLRSSTVSPAGGLLFTDPFSSGSCHASSKAIVSGKPGGLAPNEAEETDEIELKVKKASVGPMSLMLG